MSREVMQQALEALQSKRFTACGWRTECDKAITALRAALAEQAQPLVVPPGWRMVPEEPTQEMVATAGPGTFWIAEAKRTWRTMVAAAPEAPTPPAPQPVAEQVQPAYWGVFEGGNLHDFFTVREMAEEMAHYKGGHAVVGPIYTTPPAPQPLMDACAKLLQEALPHAEWQDKHIHPVGRETYQNWKVTVYLPVPLSEADKSPQAALTRAIVRAAAEIGRMGGQR